MYVICDRYQIVRHYSEDIRYITTQSNGVTVGTTPRLAEAIYCNKTDTYWPTKETYVGQPTYTLYQVETVPEGAEVGFTRYNNGVLEIDEELKTQIESERKASEKQEKMNESAILAAKIIAEQQTDESSILAMADLYDEWAAGINYKAKKILAYGVDANGDTQLYQVISNHTSADHWLPDQTPSLYAKIGVTEEGYLEWRRPYGTTDAYKIGDIVSYNGTLYICTEGNAAGLNTWAPDEYGWEVYSGSEEPEPDPEPEPPSYEEWTGTKTYKIGDIVSHNGQLWVCTQGDASGNNSWEPGVYGWEVYTEA